MDQNTKLSPKLEKQAKNMDDKNLQYLQEMLKNLDKRMAEPKIQKPNK